MYSNILFHHNNQITKLCVNTHCTNIFNVILNNITSIRHKDTKDVYDFSEPMKKPTSKVNLRQKN